MNRHLSSPGGSALAMVLALLPCSGCLDSLPTAPEELTSGIVVYQYANYGGESALITEDIAHLSSFRGPCEHSDPSYVEGEDDDIYHDWEDCISSVRVAPGWSATLFRDSGYHSDSLQIVADVPNLKRVHGHRSKKGMGDCLSSIRVRKIQPD
jgi:hypothetical protein